MLVVQADHDHRRTLMRPNLNNRIVALKVLALSALVFALPATEAMAGLRHP
jgi:hypothetical protein